MAPANGQPYRKSTKRNLSCLGRPLRCQHVERGFVLPLAFYCTYWCSVRWRDFYLVKFGQVGLRKGGELGRGWGRVGFYVVFLVSRLKPIWQNQLKRRREVVWRGDTWNRFNWGIAHNSGKANTSIQLWAQLSTGFEAICFGLSCLLCSERGSARNANFRQMKSVMGSWAELIIWASKGSRPPHLLQAHAFSRSREEETTRLHCRQLILLN